jgi:hypothetical protein
MTLMVTVPSEYRLESFMAKYNISILAPEGAPGASATPEPEQTNQQGNQQPTSHNLRPTRGNRQQTDDTVKLTPAPPALSVTGLNPTLLFKYKKED